VVVGVEELALHRVPALHVTHVTQSGGVCRGRYGHEGQPYNVAPGRVEAKVVVCDVSQMSMVRKYLRERASNATALAARWRRSEYRQQQQGRKWEAVPVLDDEKINNVTAGSGGMRRKRR